MALVVLDRAKQTTTTTGTGTLTLTGSIPGFQTLAGVGNGNTTCYAIESGTDWETGLGTYSAGTLSRDTVYQSSNSGAKINVASGAFVWCDVPAFFLTSKQDALVSGTNIKTLGGVSLLGSGDISSLLAKSTSVFTTGTSLTWTAPANCEWVKITVQGGGANGGAAAAQRASGGGGGGTAIKWLSVSPGDTLIYTVGGIGAASTVSSGSLTITTITANAGTAGTGTAYAQSQTAGGAGGTATGGDINITGQQGGTSYGTSTTVGTNFSGGGGNSLLGLGGAQSMLTVSSGKNGTGYGAGGGGAIGNATAGTGTGGIIIFEVF